MMSSSRVLFLLVFGLQSLAIHCFLSTTTVPAHDSLHNSKSRQLKLLPQWETTQVITHRYTTTTSLAVVADVLSIVTEPTTSLLSSTTTLPLPPLISSTMIRSVELGAFPAIGMVVVTVLGLRISTPPKVIGALQHFSAGILLTTISKEFLPEMVNAQGWQENVASGIGFFSGVGVLILIGILLPEEGEKTAEEKNNDNNNDEETSAYWDTAAIVFPLDSTSRSLRNRRMSRLSQSLTLGGGEDSNPFDSTTPMIESMDTDTTYDMNAIAAALPTAFLAAVAIDSLLDGLLIGVSTAVDPDTTGPVLAASLTVESSFLGLTIAAALRGVAPSAFVPNAILLLAASFAPASVFMGSILGGGLAPLLVDSPVLLAGVLGFGTSATLFMVAEELLLEAHEDGSEHVWWVDFQLYTGFFASVMIEKFVGM